MQLTGEVMIQCKLPWDYFQAYLDYAWGETLPGRQMIFGASSLTVPNSVTPCSCLFTMSTARTYAGVVNNIGTKACWEWVEKSRGSPISALRWWTHSCCTVIICDDLFRSSLCCSSCLRICSYKLMISAWTGKQSFFQSSKELLILKLLHVVRYSRHQPWSM